MNWYLAKMVFRIRCSNSSQKVQFDEQLRIIMAPDAKVALEKAHRFAADESMSENIACPVIKWEFVNVTEIYKLNNYIDGAEIFSQQMETDNGDLYQEKMNRKAAQTLHNLQNRLLEIY